MQDDQNYSGTVQNGWYYGYPYHPGGLAPNGVCPHCGRCPTCGGYRAFPYIYWQGNVMGLPQQTTIANQQA